MKNKNKLLFFSLPIALMVATTLVRFVYDLEVDFVLTPLFMLLLTRLLYARYRNDAFMIFKLNLSGVFSLAALIHILNFNYCKGLLLYVEAITVLYILLTIGVLLKRTTTKIFYLFSLFVPILIYAVNFYYTKEFFYITIVLSIIACHTAYISANRTNKTWGLLVLTIVPFVQVIYFTYAENYVWNFIDNDSLTSVVNKKIESSLSMKDIEGNRYLLHNDSTIYVLDFWFSGCVPCWNGFPGFQQFYDEQKSNPKLDIRSVNIPMIKDSNQNKVALQKIKKLHYTFPVYWGDNLLEQQMGINTYPTFIIYRNKCILFRGSFELGLEYLKSKDLLIEK